MNDFNKIWWGIDPGGRGCICELDEYNNVEFYPIEKISGKDIDLVGISNWIFEKINYYDNSKKYFLQHIVLEDVHSIFGSSAKSNFQFGWINGAIEGILASFRLPYTKVSPKIWQKEIWMGVKPLLKNSVSDKTVIDVKATSLVAARRLYPEIDFKRTKKSKKDDDNLVDSLMLATFAKRKY